MGTAFVLVPNFYRLAPDKMPLKPYIIARRCPAQEDVCQVIAACPLGAVTYVKDDDEPLGGKIVFDPEKCDGCGQCVQQCCGSAIELR